MAEKQQRNSDKTKSCFFEKIKGNDESLTRLTTKKEKEAVGEKMAEEEKSVPSRGTDQTDPPEMKEGHGN